METFSKQLYPQRIKLQANVNIFWSTSNCKVNKRWWKRKVNIQVNNRVLFTEECKSSSITCETKLQTLFCTKLMLLNLCSLVPLICSQGVFLSTFFHIRQENEYFDFSRVWKYTWVGFECFFVNGDFIETLIQLFSCWLQQQTMTISSIW